MRDSQFSSFITHTYGNKPNLNQRENSFYNANKQYDFFISSWMLNATPSLPHIQYLHLIKPVTAIGIMHSRRVKNLTVYPFKMMAEIVRFSTRHIYNENIFIKCYLHNFHITESVVLERCSHADNIFNPPTDATCFHCLLHWKWDASTFVASRGY